MKGWSNGMSEWNEEKKKNKTSSIHICTDHIEMNVYVFEWHGYTFTHTHTHTHTNDKKKVSCSNYRHTK